MTADAPNVPSVQGAREARYAEAWNNAEARWCEGDTHSADAELGRNEYCARAVMAVADAEVAAAVSEAQAEARYTLSLAEQIIRDKEDEVERLREGIGRVAQALIDQAASLRDVGARSALLAASRGIDALLAPSPAAATGEAEEERLEAALDAQMSLLSAPNNWQARAEAAERELRARELHHFETEQENAAMRQGLAALAELAEVQEKFNDLLHDVRWLRSRMDDPNAAMVLDNALNSVGLYRRAP